MKLLSILVQQWQYHHLCKRLILVNISGRFWYGVGVNARLNIYRFERNSDQQLLGSSGLFVVRSMIWLDSLVWIYPEMCWSLALLMETEKKKSVWIFVRGTVLPLLFSTMHWTCCVQFSIFNGSFIKQSCFKQRNKMNCVQVVFLASYIPSQSKYAVLLLPANQTAHIKREWKGLSASISKYYI